MNGELMAGIFSGNLCGPVYFSGLFLTGLIFGLTVCSFSCMPVVCTWVMGTQRSFTDGFRSVLTFSAGRVGGYTIVGMLCGFTGMAAETFFRQNLIVTGSGLLFLLTGVSVAFSGNGKRCTAKSKIFNSMPKSRRLHMSVLGLITGMMPCIPYSAVMAGAAASGSVFTGGLSAFVFGLGTSVSPLLIAGGGAGWFAGRIAKQIPEHSSMLRKINGCILSLIGIRMIAF